MKTTEIRELPCHMSQTEVVLKSKALAAKLDEKAAVLLEKKLANDRFKERIEECDEAVLKLSREVRTRLEERPIECTESPRYGEMMVDLIRMDTGEVVSSRPMHPSERQQALSLEGGGEAA